MPGFVSLVVLSFLFNKDHSSLKALFTWKLKLNPQKPCVKVRHEKSHRWRVYSQRCADISLLWKQTAAFVFFFFPRTYTIFPTGSTRMLYVVKTEPSSSTHCYKILRLALLKCDHELKCIQRRSSACAMHQKSIAESGSATLASTVGICNTRNFYPAGLFTERQSKWSRLE